jgi:hypothetical protein
MDNFVTQCGTGCIAAFLGVKLEGANDTTNVVLVNGKQKIVCQKISIVRLAYWMGKGLRIAFIFTGIGYLFLLGVEWWVANPNPGHRLSRARALVCINRAVDHFRAAVTDGKRAEAICDMRKKAAAGSISISGPILSGPIPQKSPEPGQRGDYLQERKQAQLEPVPVENPRNPQGPEIKPEKVGPNDPLAGISAGDREAGERFVSSSLKKIDLKCSGAGSRNVFKSVANIVTMEFDKLSPGAAVAAMITLCGGDALSNLAIVGMLLTAPFEMEGPPKEIGLRKLRGIFAKIPSDLRVQVIRFIMQATGRNYVNMICELFGTDGNCGMDWLCEFVGNLPPHLSCLLLDKQKTEKISSILDRLPQEIRNEICMWRNAENHQDEVVDYARRVLVPHVRECVKQLEGSDKMLKAICAQKLTALENIMLEKLKGWPVGLSARVVEIFHAEDESLFLKLCHRIKEIDEGCAIDIFCHFQPENFTALGMLFLDNANADKDYEFVARIIAKVDLQILTICLPQFVAVQEKYAGKLQKLLAQIREIAPERAGELRQFVESAAQPD